MAEPQQQKKQLQVETPPAAPSDGIEFFRVMEDVDLFGNGNTTRLKRGKVLSSKGYDIQQLRDNGVKLEAVPEPHWHKRVVERGQELRKERGDRAYPAKPLAPRVA